MGKITGKNRDHAFNTGVFRTEFIRGILSSIHHALADFDFRNRRQFLLFSIAYSISLAQLLAMGYGGDADGWRIVNSAWNLLHFHEYAVSRFPGYPVAEFLYVPFVWGGYLLTNAATLGISLLGVYSFNRIVTSRGVKNPGLLTLLLVASPLWYMWSTATMDYILSASFLLAAIWLAESGRFAPSGFFLSLSVGARLVNVVLAVLFLAYLIRRGTNLRECVKFVGVGLLTALVWLIPLVSTYGLSFLTFYESESRRWSLRAATMLVGASYGLLFCVAGILVLLCMTLIGIHRLVVKRQGFSFRDNDVEITMLLAVSMLFVLFVYQPLEGEYIIPAIPLLLIALGRLMPKKVLWMLLVCVLISSFVPVGPFRSPVERMVSNRVDSENISQMLLSRSFGNNDVLLAGWFAVRLNFFRMQEIDENWEDEFVITYQPTAERIEIWRLDGKTIYYIAHLKSFFEHSGIDLDFYDAIAIHYP